MRSNNSNTSNNVSLARRGNIVTQSYPASLGLASGFFDDLYPILSASPFQIMDRMQQDMDRLFSQMTGLPERQPRQSGAQMASAFLSPTVDVSETDKDYRIDLELPGVAQDAVDIRLVEGMLIVRAEAREETGTEPQANQAQQRRYHYRERRWGRFERTFSLPADADEESIAAKFEAGILTLTVPKKAQQPVQQPQGRRIAINSASSRTNTEIDPSSSVSGPSDGGNSGDGA